MSCSINLYTVNFADKQSPISFEAFVKEKGVPIYVFKDLISNPKKQLPNNIRGKRLTPGELRRIQTKIKEIQKEYAQFLEEQTQRKIRWLRTENNMCNIKSDLNYFVNNEKRKLNYKLFKIRNRLNKENAEKLSSKAEYKSNNIITDGIYKIRALTSDAVEMASTEEVSDVMSYVIPRIEKLTQKSKYSFNKLSYDLEKGKY